MIWYDMIWYDMIWYDMIWYDMIWYYSSKPGSEERKYDTTTIILQSYYNHTIYTFFCIFILRRMGTTILQWHYNDTTTIIQRCYNDTTMILQWYYNDTTTMLQVMILQWCYIMILHWMILQWHCIMMLQWCSIIILRWYYNDTTMILQRCYNDTATMLQWYYNDTAMILYNDTTLNDTTMITILLQWLRMILRCRSLRPFSKSIGTECFCWLSSSRDERLWTHNCTP